MLSFTEENYLKAIYRLSNGGVDPVLTNDLADSMKTKAASATDMVKRLATKKLIFYQKYHGANHSAKGKSDALIVIRKHRLWETFLVQKLDFTWDEVHEVAEQLEHIQSKTLIEKLDAFLGFPKTDPHGHPIPDATGKLKEVKQVNLSEFPAKKKCVVRAVKNGSPSFLQYLSKIGIRIGALLNIVDKIDFDGSLEISIDNKKRIFISREAAENLLVTE
jgi:DtxR family Mn-dependent transcriptional regulator